MLGLIEQLKVVFIGASYGCQQILLILFFISPVILQVFLHKKTFFLHAVPQLIYEFSHQFHHLTTARTCLLQLFISLAQSSWQLECAFRGQTQSLLKRWKNAIDISTNFQRRCQTLGVCGIDCELSSVEEGVSFQAQYLASLVVEPNFITIFAVRPLLLATYAQKFLENGVWANLRYLE